MITVVSGLARCGTSLTMGALHAAGVPLLCCQPPQTPFEFPLASLLPARVDWLDAAEGRAVKILDPLRFTPPKGRNYRVVFLTRDPIEQAKSHMRLAVKDATLYCTTFPCHMCARHILASGIKRVVYIEPYPKSLAKDLYEKSIRVDGDTKADDDALTFQPFVGIAPSRYIEFFEMLERKYKRGFSYLEDYVDSKPRVKFEFPVYVDLEKGYTESLAKHGLVRSGDSLVESGGGDGGEKLVGRSSEQSKD